MYKEVLRRNKINMPMHATPMRLQSCMLGVWKLSPRKTRYAVPEWRAKSIRDRRKKLLYGPYNCPKCRKKKLAITLDKKKKEVFATCKCGFEALQSYREIFEPIDYYNKMLDKMHEEHSELR